MLSRLRATRLLRRKNSTKQCLYLFACCSRLVLIRDSEKFSQAIDIEPENHVLYSNRSGAFASKKEFQKALDDANKITEIKPDWAKGWGRKGAALHGTGELGKSHLLV